MRPRTGFARGAAAVAAAAVVATALSLAATAADREAYDPWPDLKRDVFDNRDIMENTGAVTLEAPYRAEDAATVPLTMRISPDIAATAAKLFLVIDKNPAPVAATFAFGPAAGSGERVITTRVRIDEYSFVRAVVETADRKLHMAAKFVKAAGGCSAPALKDADAALANVGKMQIKLIEQAATTSAMRVGQLMIRHPQYSGLQMNQLTGLYIPAKFLTEIDVKRGEELVFRVEGGISLSEDPNIRFTYAAGPDETLEVTATDTDGRTFTQRAGPKGS